jgi:hypothetical protein
LTAEPREYSDVRIAKAVVRLDRIATATMAEYFEPDAAACAASNAARQEAAANNAADLADTVRDIQEAGIRSANGIATELNRLALRRRRADIGKQCRFRGCSPVWREVENCLFACRKCQRWRQDV